MLETAIGESSRAMPSATASGEENFIAFLRKRDGVPHVVWETEIRTARPPRGLSWAALAKQVLANWQT
jgi:hypothetical protein